MVTNFLYVSALGVIPATDVTALFSSCNAFFLHLFLDLVEREACHRQGKVSLVASAKDFAYSYSIDVSNQCNIREFIFASMSFSDGCSNDVYWWYCIDGLCRRL